MKIKEAFDWRSVEDTSTLRRHGLNQSVVATNLWGSVVAAPLEVIPIGWKHQNPLVCSITGIEVHGLIAHEYLQDGSISCVCDHITLP